jgi:hypothetical protein
MVIVMTMPSPTIMVLPMAVVMVVVVPMSLVHFPTFAVVVIMWMSPVCPFIWRTVPAPLDPSVMVTDWHPISFHPDEVWARRWPTFLVADCGWWSSDVHRNLR